MVLKQQKEKNYWNTEIWKEEKEGRTQEEAWTGKEEKGGNDTAEWSCNETEARRREPKK